MDIMVVTHYDHVGPSVDIMVVTHYDHGLFKSTCEYAMWSKIVHSSFNFKLISVSLTLSLLAFLAVQQRTINIQ